MNGADGDLSRGGEIAVELRGYSRENQFSGLNGGVYLGLGLIDDEEQGTRVAITPGMKLTVSWKPAGAPLLLEPYLGFSCPLIRESDEDAWGAPEPPVLTLGFRLVFRHLGAYSEDTGLSEFDGPGRRTASIVARSARGRSGDSRPNRS